MAVPAHSARFVQADFRILIFRNPEGDQYQTRLTAIFGDALSVLAFQDVITKAEQLLG